MAWASIALSVASARAQPPPEPPAAIRLAALAQQRSADLAAAIRATFSEADLRNGTACTARESEFFFALEAASPPTLVIDGAAGQVMAAAETAPGPSGNVTKAGLWFASVKLLPVGSIHRFSYLVAGRPFGGKSDVPVFGPLSYQQPGVPVGTLSAKTQIRSQVYEGMVSDYWVYIPAQYRPEIPAAMMVFQDGGRDLERTGLHPVLNVVDNLIAQGKIPPVVCIFTDQGDISGAPGTATYRFVEHVAQRWGRTLRDAMRSTEYDTVSDRYARFLRDELLPAVAARVNIRKDGYSRAILGSSSGGIAAFNAAWQMPDEFTRVLSVVGSFTSIQWKEDPANPDGGQDYPDKVLREPLRNVRVWLVDGANDQENPLYGSWPLGNVRLANALKSKGYDFRFSFGVSGHSEAESSAQYPEELMWLWRDYDPKKTSQKFEMEAAERARPPFRIRLLDRGP